VDDILIHPRDRDLILATHGRSIWIADDITPLEQLKPPGNTLGNQDLVLFDPRPATLWKNDPQAQRRAANREFKGQNPQGGTAISVWARSDMGAGKLEFLLNNQVASTMDVQIKAGMNRFQWAMRGPAPAGGGRGGRSAGGEDGAARVAAQAAPAGNAGAPNAPAAASVPFVAGGRGVGGGGGGGAGGGGRFGGGVPVGPLLEPGTYIVRLTAGSQTLTSSVTVLEDIWMRPQ
jgi:hypothetical protein